MFKRTLACVALLITCTVARGEDAFYSVSLSGLTLTDGSTWPNGSQFMSQGSRIRIEGGEGYNTDRWGGPGDILHLRTTNGKPPTGALTIFEPGSFGHGSEVAKPVRVTFRVDAAPSKEAKKEFFEAKAASYTSLMNGGAAGSAWFRYQAGQALREVSTGANAVPPAMPGRNRSEDTFDFFTGGRAIAENLQLDQAMTVTRPAADTVEVDSLAGISVAAMDFATLNKDAAPARDVLASFIPADQHAIFFPSVAAARITFDQFNDSNLPVLQPLIMETRQGLVLEQYQRQLGLHATKLAELLGPQMVKSIAVTGSDPFFPTGTDVAILFDSPNPQALYALLATQIMASSTAVPSVQIAKNDGDGISYVSMVSPDRQMSSYLATSGNVVIVTNSTAQLDRLVQVKQGKTAKLADAPEYTFFRSRYAMGQDNETAFLVLTDATIRRWCSAKWRIAEARRIQAMALMADARAAELAASRGMAAVDKIVSADKPFAAYGRFGFLTPIAEMELPKVSKEEADAYGRWRDGYQQNWRGTFDPIAIRFSRSEGRIAADLTVMPLIAGTEYRELIELSTGAKLSATSGDPHDVLGHVVLAINRDSARMKQWAGMGRSMIPGVKIDPLSWLGASVALYADDDPYWKDLASAKDKEKFMSDNLGRLPLALRLESTNGLKLAAFVAGVRTMMEQSSPGLTTWEPVEHAGLGYVKVTSRNQRGTAPDFAIYYAALSDSLVVSMNETVIRHSIERSAARRPSTAPAAPAAVGVAGVAGATNSAPASRPSSHAWLGSNLSLQLDATMAEMLFGLNQRDFARSLQRASWSNLTILNEWKRLAPEEDPVVLHERWWGERLVCPSGGKYVWNDKLQTMESTATGCPEAPKLSAVTRLDLKGVRFGNFGLGLENQGLRARVELDVDKK